MTGLSIPALDGRTPLGFLAALGVLRLVVRHGHPRARLAWSRGGCTAELHDAQSSLDELAGDLQAIIDAIPEGGVLPGLPVDFPPLGAAPDKLRLQRSALRGYTETLHAQAPDAEAELEAWLCSLVTDLSLDDQGRADITLFAAPSGKQSMRTMLEKPLAAVRENPDTVMEALVGWRRYPGVTGEYLDHRVLFDGADAPDGRSMERGVPAATWLALMSYPLFLTSALGAEPLTTGWQPSRGKGHRRRFVYPLWSTPVDPPGAIALLTHRVLSRADPGAPPPAARPASIFLICAAQRRTIPGRTFAGVLAPVPMVPAAARRRPRKPGGGRLTGGLGPIIL